MNKTQRMILLRMKKLGILLCDARLSVRRSEEECALAIGISADQYKSYEKGLHSPSLPELEALAFYLNFPLEHFWGDQVISQTKAPAAPYQEERLRSLRDRIIGAQLRSKRSENNISLNEISEEAGISADLIELYETGQKSIPLAELEMLASILQINLEGLFDQSGVIGKWRLEQQFVQRCLELPPEIREFVAVPIHRPYLEVAMRLSEFSVERLRSVAEGLLDITY